MEIIRSVCPRDCYDTCFVKAVIDKGRLVKVLPDDTNPITSNFLCARGYRDADRVYSDKRILTPYLRKSKPGGGVERISWREALKILSSKIKEIIKSYGPEAILRLDYSGSMGLLTSVFSRRLWVYLRATQTDYTICSAAGHEALKLHYGASYGLYPDEIPRMKLIIFWGFNARVGALHIWLLANKARDSGGMIISIDPIKTVTAEASDLHIRPKPGSDTTLAYGVMKALIENEYIDKDFIEKHTYGFEKLKNYLDSLSKDEIEVTTGVEWRDIEKLAKLYSEYRPSATLIGFGIQKSMYGGEAVRAISLIPALVGMHRGFYYSNSSGWIYDRRYLTGEKFVSGRPRIVNQVSVGRLIEKGEFKLIYIYGTNPVQTLPNAGAVMRGLSRQDVFVVIHDTHWTETAEYADLILPAATYLEKDDIVFSYSHRYVRLSKKAIEPLGESKTEVWVMQSLARELGVDNWVLEDPWHALEKALESSFVNCSFKDLLGGKLCILRVKPRDVYQTPSGKIELYSLKAEELGYTPLPRQYPLVSGKYILITSTYPKYTHTQFQEIYGSIPSIVVINPLDADDLGIEEGDLARIFNEKGEVVLKAMISDRVPPGIIWAPKVCSDIYGRPINILTSDTPQKIGNGSTFNSTYVKIERYEVDIQSG